MKIGILTLPLYNNYGGILQAFALKTSLERMGHNTIFIKRYSNTNYVTFSIKQLLALLGLPRYSKKRFKNITEFVNKEFNFSKSILSNESFRKIIKKESLDAIIVGSDQVWRKDFAIGSGFDYFLDLGELSIKRIAYAASFGIDYWSYNSIETQKIKQCLSLFSGISLREKNFIPILENNTGYKAQQCLDPTLLLSPNIYKKFIKQRPISNKFKLIYWLGSDDNLKEVLHLNNDIQTIRIRLDSKNCYSVEDWLTYIYFAEEIITDSFHGCVFSLLFHKQFKVYKNVNGGVSRLSSLFKMFEIEELLNDPNYKINYEKFDQLLNKYQKHSIEFISTCLNK